MFLSMISSPPTSNIDSICSVHQREGPDSVVVTFPLNVSTTFLGLDPFDKNKLSNFIDGTIPITNDLRDLNRCTWELCNH